MKQVGFAIIDFMDNTQWLAFICIDLTTIANDMIVVNDTQ